MNGLVIGKFAPIHKGHQLLIDIALGENDKVYVVCYNSPVFKQQNPWLTPELRVSWIKKLYPQDNVIAIPGKYPPHDIQGPAGDMIHAAYVMGLVNDMIDSMYGSEDYITHMAKFMSAQPRVIDPKRSEVPVSATDIRNGGVDHIDPQILEEYRKGNENA